MKKLSLRAATVALLLGAGVLNTACEKQLDIKPTASIDAEVALGDAGAVESAVVGTYALLDAPALYGTNLLLLPDLLGADGYLNWQGTFQGYREAAQHNMNSVNSEALRTWRDAYRAINLSNLIVEALPVVSNASRRDQLEGEMRMVRGMLYFELVRLYALPIQAGGGNPGVPLVLTGNKSVDQAGRLLPRNTVQEVYTQIEQDLQTAVSKLPETNASSATRLDRSDAKAFLARVYLQQGKYALARDLADDVIENSGAQLNGSVLDAFTSRGSDEVLFEIQQNDQNNAGNSNDGLATFYSSNASGFGGRGDVQVLASFEAQYSASDQRGTQGGAPIGASLIYTGDGTRPGRLRSYKWNDAAQNIPVIRLAEMYLIRAEANQRLGTAVGAAPVDDINELRDRAGAPLLATGITLNDILRERELELAFEGFRIHDLRRTQRNIGSRPYNSADLVMPIPQYEINLGNALPQNPGY